jgi:hypothetical protein
MYTYIHVRTYWCIYIVTCFSEYRQGLDWMIGFIQSSHAYKQHSAIADLHNLQFTITLGFSVVTSSSLVTELKQSLWLNHLITLSLHMLTSNSSSTTNFPQLSSTDNGLGSHSHTLCCTPLYSLVFPFSWPRFFHNNSVTTSELPIPIL